MSNIRPVVELTIAEAHAGFAAGTLTVEQLVRAYLERIAAYDQHGPTLNAVVTMNPQALAVAATLDRDYARSRRFIGPLHGVPLLVKDNIEVAGLPCTQGLAAFADYRPEHDAHVIAQLRAAGAIILGKTTLPDFASSWWAYSSLSGETRNPYDLARDPGGSSAGSGAAAAANFALAALGTDCGGSIRVPASCNNLVGVRSTPGLASRSGTGPLVYFQDTVGPMARTVTDCARLFECMVGYDVTDNLTAHFLTARAPASYSAPLTADALNGARLGLVTNALGDDQSPYASPVNAIVRAAVSAIRAHGADVIEMQLPDLARHLLETSMYVNCSKAEINTFLRARPKLPLRSLQQIYDQRAYHPMLDLLEACTLGPELPEYDPQYFRRLAAREVFQRTIINTMGVAGVDALIYPTIQVIPPTREQLNARQWTTLTFPTNTLIASQSWLPAISVPAGLTPAGLPVGLEILGRSYDEPRLFGLAYAFEQATRARRAPTSTPELH